MKALEIVGKMMKLRISQIYFTLPTFNFWNLLRSIRVTLASFLGILNLTRGFIEYTNPRRSHVCLENFFYLPTSNTTSILAQNIGVSQVEQNGISLPRFFSRFSTGEYFLR